MATFNGALIGQNITGTRSVYRTRGFTMNDSSLLTGSKQQKIIHGLMPFGVGSSSDGGGSTEIVEVIVEVVKKPRVSPLEHSWKKLIP